MNLRKKNLTYSTIFKISRKKTMELGLFAISAKIMNFMKTLNLLAIIPRRKSNCVIVITVDVFRSSQITHFYEYTLSYNFLAFISDTISIKKIIIK